MFERFTDRARHVVVLSQEEARELGHNYIGTEHLLLALAKEGEGVAAKTLQSLEVTTEAVRDAIIELIGRGDSEPMGHIPFTPHAKKVLELALREAMQLGHNYIGTEHLLLGVIRLRDAQADIIMQHLKLDLAKVRTRAIEMSHSSRPELVDDPGKLATPLSDSGYTVEDTLERLSDILIAAQLSVEEAYVADKGITLPEAKRQVAEIYRRIGVPAVRYKLCVTSAYMLEELVRALNAKGAPRNPKLRDAVDALVGMCIDEVEGPSADQAG